MPAHLTCDPTAPPYIRMRPSHLASLLLVISSVCAAQNRSTLYPNEIYVGDNAITISSANGIESIRVTPSRTTSIVVPTITGCPREVSLRVQLASPSVEEVVNVLVVDCHGSLTTLQLRTENWTIRHERTGVVEVGRDTCLVCEIVTAEAKIVDSIVVRDDRFRVEMPPGGGPWRVPPSTNGSAGFNYTVCYRPRGTERIESKIYLYIRREQPSGGLTQYVIEKPISALGIPPAPPPVTSRDDSLRERNDALNPPVVDPTTFRTILAPTAETLGAGDWFIGSFDLVGLLGGYGVSDDITMLAGGAFVPASISKIGLASVGGKWRALTIGPWQGGVGAQFAMSTTDESDIRVAATYGVISLGDRRNRFSVAFGYSWKRHVPVAGIEFDRDAAVMTIGGDVMIARQWKLAAEAYYIQSSGLAPVTIATRWFNSSMALDLGFIVDLGSGADISSSGALSGEIENLRIAPLVSFIWRFQGNR